MFAFLELSLTINLVIFAAAAVAVWLAGSKLSRHVDLIADRTGLGEAFAGALLLGGTTSLPELATTLTAAHAGAIQLAASNLLGGVVMQIVVLAVIDALVFRRAALTLFSPQSSLLMVGVMLIGLLAITSAAVAAGELFSVAGVGFWPIVLFAAYLFSLRVIYRYEGQPRWQVSGELAEPPESSRDMKDAFHAVYEQVPTRRLFIYLAAASCVVLIGGYLVARTGEAIAAQTGMGQNFVGATLIALATSLPEVSTTYAAVRFGAYSMAAANILGTNAIAIALFLPAELAYRGGPMFDALDSSSGFLAAMGILVTGLYLWGMLERRDRTIFGMGRDSFSVLVVYAIGMLIYFYL